MNEFPEEKVKGLFALAGLQVLNMWRLENMYWPDHANYADIRSASPWWLIKTEFGLIRIGWRKRVLSIDWTDTDRSFDVKEDVTKSLESCHAWSYAKAVDYLTRFRFESVPNPPRPDYSV